MKVDLTDKEINIIVSSLPYGIKEPLPNMNPMFYFLGAYEDDVKLHEQCKKLRNKLKGK